VVGLGRNVLLMAGRLHCKDRLMEWVFEPWVGLLDLFESLDSAAVPAYGYFTARPKNFLLFNIPSAARRGRSETGTLPQGFSLSGLSPEHRIAHERYHANTY